MIAELKELELSPQVISGTVEVTDAELDLITPILRQLLVSDLSIREKIERRGLQVVPVDYRSNTPSLEEIRDSFEYVANEKPPYLDEKLFDRRAMAKILKRISKYAGEFQPDLDGNPTICQRFYWKNIMFSYSDAMAYYCFIRHYRPKTIVEIGSGHSTHVALEAVRRNGEGRVICVEPYPPDFLKNTPGIELVVRPAQEIDVAQINRWLAHDGDFLFIDSSHMVKTGSDCAHIYLRLLPKIRGHILVHAHDIFLPFGMPQHWLLDEHIHWTEQHLLMALLIDNPRARVLFGSVYHDTFNKAALDRMMGGKFRSGGASLWFDYRGGRPSILAHLRRALLRRIPSRLAKRLVAVPH